MCKGFHPCPPRRTGAGDIPQHVERVNGSWATETGVLERVHFGSISEDQVPHHRQVSTVSCTAELCSSAIESNLAPDRIQQQIRI